MEFKRIVSFDTEGYIGWRGRQPGTFVCVTWAILENGAEHPRTGISTSRSEFVEMCRDWMTDDETLVIAQNAYHDLGVLLLVEPELLGVVFRAVHDGRISCTQTREKLITIAHGHAMIDPVLGRPPVYSLAQLVLKYLDIDISSKKERFREPDDWLVHSGAHDPERTVWRVNYHQLHGVPLEQWPESATEYATQDAELTLMVHRAQCFVEDTPSGPVVQPDGIWIVDEIPNIRAGWALHLCSVWGLRTDPQRVEETLAEWKRIRASGLALGYELGFVRGEDRVLKGGHIRPRKKADREAYCAEHGLPVDFDGWESKGKAWSIARGPQQDAISAAYESRGQSTPRNPPTALAIKKHVEEFGDEAGVEGSIKYDADTLRLSGDDRLAAFAEATEYMNYFNKFAGILRTGTTHPITSRPNVIVRTGRTSWSNPPLQQPPKKGGYRECHVPRPGFVFVSIDYDSIEMAALAQIHLDWNLGSTMADQIRDGVDLNTSFGAFIADLPYEMAIGWKREAKLGPCPDWGVFRDGARFRAKAANYGFGGGMGALTFLTTQLKQGATLAHFAPDTGSFEEALQTARKLKSDWLTFFPEMKDYFNIIGEMVELAGSYTAVQPVSNRLRGDTGYCDGCNTYFQGRVADGAKAALWEVSARSYGASEVFERPKIGAHSSNAMHDVLQLLERESYVGTPDDPLYGCRPVLMMHDEIIAEVPEDRLNPAADEMAKCMRDVMALYIPDVPIGAEPAAMRRWYKGADTVRDDDGKLLVWEPRS